MKNIFLLTLILLTSVLFGQTTKNILFIGNNNTIPNSGTSTNLIIAQGTISIVSNTFVVNTVLNTLTITNTNAGILSNLLVDTLTGVISIDKQGGINPVASITITNGTETHSVTTNTTSSPVTYTFGFSSLSAGINDVNRSLPLETYSNLNSIFIKNTQNIEDVKLEVFNLAGQLVFEEKITKDKFDLNVPTGMYTVRLSKGDKFVTKKLYLKNSVE